MTGPKNGEYAKTNWCSRDYLPLILHKATTGANYEFKSWSKINQ